MKTYRFTLKILSAFGTPLVGDTLFGQLCWAISHHFGEEKLQKLLKGYAEQRPFAVLSDALPQGYLPLPTLPSRFWAESSETDRKVLKKKQWIALADTSLPLAQWQANAKSEKDLFKKQTADQFHNTIDRQTATTGEGIFAPYTTENIWYQADQLLDLYVVLDEDRLSVNECEILLKAIGLFGFGRDASIGLGKFEVVDFAPFEYNTPAGANAYLTLANCSPQNVDLNAERCFYQLTTRFGRHGDIKALSQNPFKKPLILAKYAAVFSPNKWQEKAFLGNGLTHISYAQQNAVHQGYAPVIPLKINFD